MNGMSGCAFFERGSRLRVAAALTLGVVLQINVAGIASAQEVGGGCGALQNPFGPYDYRADKFVPFSTFTSVEKLRKSVEDFHFRTETTLLRRLPTSPGTPVGSDLSYTLRALPNHHHALLTLIALGEKEKTSQPQGSLYTIECWFRRAITFRPDDNTVRLIYATYLVKENREKEADEELSFAASQAGDNPFTLHNIGLVYFDMKDYEKALQYANKAYAPEWFGIPTLRDKLKSVGKWVDPVAGPKSESESK